MNIYLSIVALVGFIGFLFSGRRFLSRGSVRSVCIMLFWVSVCIFALYPQAARVVSTTLHLGENLNTLIFLGFIIVFFLLFRVFHSLDVAQRDLTHMVRAQALKDFKAKNNLESK